MLTNASHSAPSTDGADLAYLCSRLPFRGRAPATGATTTVGA